MRTRKSARKSPSRRDTLLMGAVGALAVVGCGTSGSGGGSGATGGGSAGPTGSGTQTGTGTGTSTGSGGVSGTGGSSGAGPATGGPGGASGAGGDPSGAGGTGGTGGATGDAGGRVDAGSAGSGGGTDAAADRAIVVDSGPITCVVKPAQTEGPYFVDEMLNRSDIRSDPSDAGIPSTPGAEFQLTMGIYRAGGACSPIPGALVDIWQCNASGVYSDAMDPSFDTRGQKFLRGYQITDQSGVVQFITIYPGWYPGRAVHIHFKIRTSPNAGEGTQFTSQLYFDDAFTDQVYMQAPYNTRGNRTTRNPMDGIFGQDGAELTLAVTKVGQIYAARFNLGLNI